VFTRSRGESRAPRVLPTAPAVVSSERLAGTPTTVTVPGRVSLADIEQTLSVLHAMRGLIVIDLSTALSAPLEHCKIVATSWPSGHPAPSAPHTRLAILVRFEHWALIRNLVIHELELLATKGVEAILCCEEQRWDQWFTEGRIVHDVERVLRTLSALVERQPAGPSCRWRILLEAAASLLDGSPPDALCELARIGLACGSIDEALHFANEAIRVAPGGSVLECRALRLLGAAMIKRDWRVGVSAIEDALGMAIRMAAEATDARRELALHELRLCERAIAEAVAQLGDGDGGGN